MQSFVSSGLPQMNVTPAVVPTPEFPASAALTDRQTADRLTNRLGRSELSFELDNDPWLIRPLVIKLCDHIKNFSECGDQSLANIEMALHEALSNSLYHGNLELNSELRRSDEDQYYRLAEQRRLETPYDCRRIHVRVVLSRFHVVFSIRDEGPGFDPKAIPDPTAQSQIAKPFGRGLALMRHCMNRVTFSDSGNQVTMVKRLGTIADAR